MYEYYVKEVSKIIDGDTIDVVIDLGFDILHKSRIRLAGIDAPESRTKDLEEKALGLEAKEYLRNAIKSASKIVIKTERLSDTEKYGRILGWIYLDGSHTSINNQMILKGYAWQYDGETKDKNISELLKIRKEYEESN